MKKDNNIVSMCEAAIAIALAMGFGYIKIIELPQGGSVGIGMLPIFIYCYKWGIRKSFFISFTYGLLQLILDGAYAWSPLSMVLDYICAYGALGICGLFNKDIVTLSIGVMVAVFGRFIFHFVSGATVFAITSPTTLLNIAYTNPLIYSAVYNASYLICDLAICIVIILLLHKLIDKYKATSGVSN